MAGKFLLPGSLRRGRWQRVHRVELDGDRVARYAIVAPTEWNFHPQGASVREMTGRPAATRGEAALAAHRLPWPSIPACPSR
jgi:Ni,Fe-hydrogenase I large subunit